MPNNNSRHIRVVDRHPAQHGFASLGDVPCSVKICIDFEVANSAPECRPSSGSEMTASRASFAGMLWVHLEHDSSLPVALVFQLSGEVSICPSSYHTVEFSPLRLRGSCMQSLDGNDIESHSRYVLSYAMVQVKLKPSLSPAQPPQMTLRRTSACSLQLFSQVPMSATDISCLGSTKESAIGQDCDIDDPSVNSEDSRIVRNSACMIWHCNHEMANNPPLLCPHLETLDFSTEILTEVLGHRYPYSLPASHRGNGHDASAQERSESPTVETNSRPGILTRKTFKSIPLQYVRSLIPGTLHQRGPKTGPNCPSLLVATSLKVSFVEPLGCVSDLEKEIAHLIVDPDCFEKFRLSGHSNSNYTFHSHQHLAHNQEYEYHVTESTRIHNGRTKERLPTGIVTWSGAN